jgi:hypothetical protein
LWFHFCRFRDFRSFAFSRSQSVGEELDLKLHRLLCVTALALCAGGARADRLIWIPTAAISRPQVEYMTEADGSRSVLTGQIGFLKQFDLIARYYQNFEDKDRTEIGGEYVVLPEGLATPGVAIGVWDVADVGPRGLRFFGVVSKSLPVINSLPLGIHDAKLHVGIGSGSLSGVFLGGQIGFPFGFGLYAEYDARDFNAGISWSPVGMLRLKAESWDGQVFVGAQLRSPVSF